MERIAVTVENPKFDFDTLDKYIKQNGYYSEWVPRTNNNQDDVIRRVKGYDAVLAGGDIYNRYVLESISDTVKVIARFGIGYDKIDMEAATSLGIAVTNAPGRMSAAVAEMALLLMLGVARRVCHFDENVKRGYWQQSYIGSQLQNKIIGLVGFGSIAGKLAEYLQGFCCKILAYDKYFDEEKAKMLSVEYASIERIVSESDYVSLHVPLTEETAGMVDYNFLCAMKPGAYLINTGRGALVKEEDLINALRQKKIAGAGLDVLEKEPAENNNPLLEMDNVIITPHIAASTSEAFKDAGRCAADNIIDVFKGKQPENILNPDYIKFKNILKEILCNER